MSAQLKNLCDNKASLTMMKQIKKWGDQLDSYEKEMNGLLKKVSNANEP